MAAAALVVVALGSAAVWPVASLVAEIPDATIAPGPLSAADVLSGIVLPALFVAAGWGVLYHGVVQPQLRERLGPAGTVAALTTLVSLLYWLGAPAAQAPLPFAMTLVLTGVVLLSLLLAPVVSRGVRLGVELLHLDWRPLTAGVGVVLVLALVVVIAVGTGLVGPSRLAWGIGYSVAGAAACVGAERTRSLWVPVAVYAVFVFFTDIQVGSLLTGALL